MNDMERIEKLNREYWGRVYIMCKGTNVKPWECVKLHGKVFDKHPAFRLKCCGYEFAVAILEDKPV